jgi:hypothetical protein
MLSNLQATDIYFQTGTKKQIKWLKISHLIKQIIMENKEISAALRSVLDSTREKVYMNLSYGDIELAAKQYKERNAIGLSLFGESVTGNDSLNTLNDVLEKFPLTEEICLTSGYIRDWKGFEGFKKLRALHFESSLIASKQNKDFYYPRIDLSWFKDLEMFGSWNMKYVTNLEFSKVKDLWLTKKFATKDLSKIHFPQTLEKLWLGYNPISTLNGIEKAINLKKLTIQMLSKLSDMSILSDLKNLETLSIAVCRSVDYDSLKNDNLRSLNVYIETEHSRSKLPSLHFLKNLPNLETLSLMCPIIDGDMTPILELPNLKKVLFNDKKHHSHTLKQIYDLKNLK